MRVSEDVIPIGDFKTHAARLLRKLRADGRPLLITQRGRAAAVLVTPEEFDAFQQHRAFLAAVDQGLTESEAGRLVDDADLDAEFGSLSGD